MLTVILSILPYIQIVLALFLIGLVLIQQTDTDAGGSFGGGNTANFYTRRGGEKFIFNFTIVIAILFAASVLLDLWK